MGAIVNIGVYNLLLMRMKDTADLSRFRKVSRYGSWVLAVAFFFLSAVIIFGLIGLILCLTDPGSSVDPLSNELSIALCLNAVINGVFGSILCRIAYGLMRSFGSGVTPFVEDNARRIKMLTIICLMGFVVVFVIHAFMAFVVFPEDYAVQIPMLYLVMSAILYIIYLLFEYGVALQDESDGFL